MRRFLSLIAMLVGFRAALPADSAPALEWVNRLAGSGLTSVAGAAVDAHGNLYVVGTTSSIDIPTVAATQRNAGGTPLVRINTAAGGADKLYPPGLSAISHMAADPRNPGVLYAAMTNGIFKSLTNGSSWSGLALLGPNTTINSLVIDPSNSNTLYAATTAQGILQSLDGGVSWNSIDNGIAPRSDGSVDAYQLWIDPNTPQVLFASVTNGGLVRSADGGASWTQIGTPISSTLVFDPFVANTVYLGGPQGILKSTDDGQTFAPLSTLPGPAVVASLIADPFRPGILFAASYQAGIFQSADSGATWTQKSKAQTSHLAEDPNRPVIYADAVYGIVASTDGFTTTIPLGPPANVVTQILVAGTTVFEVVTPTNDAFVWKLDANGNTVYATYFGGSSDDSATAMALGADGSVYVTGTTRSVDFPITAGVYASKMPGYPNTLASFVFRLNPDGSLGWSTYFSDFQSAAKAIAVDSAGNPYVGGNSSGGLPTTPGAYQTQFKQTYLCTGLIGCFPGPTSAFVTKLNAQGSGLFYSTYVPTDNNKKTVTAALSLAIDSSGNAWFGGNGNVVEVNSSGSALLASNFQSGVMINAVALDSNSNLYATGKTLTGLNGTLVFPATAGAFQTAPLMPTGLTNAFVIKWDGSLSHILAATLLGGELYDAGESIAINRAGNVIVSGQTSSRALPTHAPFQAAFSARTGFVAGFDTSLSHLLFSTYLGDEHNFDAGAAAADGQGNVLMAGTTLTQGGSSLGRLVANKISLPAPPAARLDSVVNAASRLAVPIAPGEPIVATGSGFGPDAQLLIDGAPLPTVSATGTTLVAIMPDGAKTSGAYQIQVSSGGVLSNPVSVAAAPTSPAIFSTDGSGVGQGYILNSDGTLNSPANPASVGSPITIYATGVGAYTLDQGYAVTALPPAVFVDVFWANGIAAVTGPVSGFPGNVFQLSVYVPDPAQYADQNPSLKNFKFPPQVAIRLGMGPVSPYDYSGPAMISQAGIVLNVQ